MEPTIPAQFATWSDATLATVVPPSLAASFKGSVSVAAVGTSKKEPPFFYSIFPTSWFSPSSFLNSYVSQTTR